VQGNTNGNHAAPLIVNIQGNPDGIARVTLFTAPFDCKIRNIFMTSDTALPTDADDYVEAVCYRFKKVNYCSYANMVTDPHYDLMTSIPITTQTGEDGTIAITADAPWPDYGNAGHPDGVSDLVLADQNLNLKKGECVKIELHAYDDETDELAIGTNSLAFTVEIEAWDPDQAGLSRTDNR